MRLGGIDGRKLALMVAAATLIASQPAIADTLRYSGPWFAPYYSSFTIHDSAPTAVDIGVSAGAFRMTDLSGPTLPAGTSFMAWCVDIRHMLNSSSAGDSYTLTSGTDFFGAASPITQRLERLASYVVDNDGNPLTTTLQSALTGNLQSAAFQLAAWEIVNEGTAAILNVLSGDFYVTGGSADVKNLANTWLTDSQAWASTQRVSVWAGPNSTQDLAVFAPIPEPETYVMLISGLGLMAFVARRRRSNWAAS